MKLNNNLNNFFSNANSIKYIIILAWVFRFSLFLISELWIDNNVIKENYVGADSEGYHVLTINLLKTGSFDTFGTFRTPGYPSYIAIFYYLFGPKPWVPILFQTFIDLLSILLVFKIGKTLFDIRIGLIAALIYAVDPHLVLFSTTLQSDTLFVFFFLSSIFFFFKGLKEQSLKILILSGSVLGIATLVRPITQFFPAVIIILLIFHFQSSWKFRIKSGILYIIAFIIFISPWIYRNNKLFGYPALSSIQGANLLFYSAAYAEVVKTGKDILVVRKEFSALAEKNGADERFNPVFPLTEEQLWNYGANILKEGHNPFKNSEIYNKIASTYIKHNLKYYIPRHIQGILNMYFALESRGISYRLGLNTKTFKFDYFAAPNLFFMAKNFIKSKPIGGMTVGVLVAIFIISNYLLFFVGSFKMIKDKNYFTLFSLVCIIGYYSAVVGVVGLARYKMPITPFCAIGASLGLLFIINYYKQRKKDKSFKSSITY